MVSKTKHSIAIIKNLEFVEFIPMILAHFLLGDPSREKKYYPTNLSNKEMGELARTNLVKSRRVEAKEILKLLGTPQEFKAREKADEENIKKTFSYKNKKAIYKNMSKIHVDIEDKELIIYPFHQNALNGFSGVSKDRKQVMFSYPLDIADEDLGKAIYEAFQHCTSIYR